QLQKGSLPRARRHFLRALRSARRHGLSDAEGRALHFLCVLDMDSGDLESAEMWGKEAYRMLGPGHVDLPRVAHDLANIWSLQGFCTRAQAVFRALLPHFSQPADRLYVLSNIVRTAGRAGDRETFEEAWAAAWELAGDPSAVDGFAVLDMARGAAFMGEHALAVQAARRSIEAASSREEAKARLEAEALLASLRSVQEREEATAAVEAPSGDGTADALAAEIIQGLNATTAP
ncbi:MAG TPA: hypothetical protein VFQ76_16410, partial [Longimicrobiaceae bacterium]|nr:hypothetical protein [Longimicrobiaceae bacterium]